jgi:hypothetical protein
MRFLLKASELLNSSADSAESFGGLGKGGLITVIIVSVLLIITVAWLIDGTSRRD